MINIAKYVINNDGIMTLRIKKSEYNYTDIEEVVETFTDIDIEKYLCSQTIEYKNYKFIISGHFYEGRQYYNITTADVKLYDKFESLFELNGPCFIFGFDILDYIYETKSNINKLIRMKYNELYFSTNGNYVDIVIFVLPEHIINTVKQIIDNMEKKEND